ncbi:MAG: DegT/DnrJ/EryC1/StrS family aminotransferase, partial [Chloroflexi bacterium]|nr:DegT/DnrJ/EryC1/StrS family aminotransferase [Chloroflexota bacterium]
LSQQLKRADSLNSIRQRNAAYLDRELGIIEGITPQTTDLRVTCNGHYAYIFHLDGSAFSGIPVRRFIEALNAEGIPTQASYPPLHSLALFKSGAYLQRLVPEERRQDHAFLKAGFPVTARGAWETVWLPQNVLLGTEEDMTAVVGAVRKIQRHAHRL